MKSIYLLLVFLLLTLFSSCKKNPLKYKPTMGNNDLDIAFNGDVSWKPDACDASAHRDYATIRLLTFYNVRLVGEEWFPYESINIRKVKKDLAKNYFYDGPIDSNSRVYFSAFYCDYDIVSLTYDMDFSDSSYNWIQITQQEDDYNHIEGVFSARLYKSESSKYCTEVNPMFAQDTLIISNAKFRVENVYARSEGVD